MARGWPPMQNTRAAIMTGMRIGRFRFPWLLVGLLAGFCASVAFGPDHYSTSRLLNAPWQYYSVIWAPALGVFCGLIIDLLLGWRSCGSK